VGVSHVRVGGVIAALEESLTSSGCRRCTLRSLATFCNNTAVPLQICLAPAGRPPPGGGGADAGGGGGGSDPGGVLVTEEAFEHQRYIPVKGWSDKHLMATERRRWSKRDGSASAKDIDEFCYRAAVLLPEGWRWDGEWSVEVGHHCDGQGWAFGTSFLDLSYPFPPGRGSMGRASFVRMRRWVRRRSLVPARAEDLTAAGTFSTVVPPGGTAALPTAAVGPDATVHLHVRRFVNRRHQQQQQQEEEEQPLPYNWGVRTCDGGAEGGTGSRLLAGAEEGAEMLCVTPPMGGGSGSASTPNWWVSLQTEATPVAAAARPGGGGGGGGGATAMKTHGGSGATNRHQHQPSANIASGRSRASMIDWRIIAAPPLTVVNALLLAAQATLLEAPAAAPDKIRPVASAGIAAGGVLAVHTLNPAAAQYLQLALEGGWRPPAAGPPLAISPASLSAAAALAGPAEAARARSAAAACGAPAAAAATNALLLAAPDGRRVHVTAEHAAVGGRGSPLAPRVTRLGVPVHLVNRCPGVDLEFRVVAAHAARKGAPPGLTSGGLAVDPAFARCSRLESSAVRFVPTLLMLVGGVPTQVLPAAVSSSSSSSSVSSSSSSSVAMLSVPHDADGGRGHGRGGGGGGGGGAASRAAGLALEIGIRSDFALSPPIPLTEEELVQGAVIIDAVDRQGRKRQLTVHMQLGWPESEGEDSAAAAAAAAAAGVTSSTMTTPGGVKTNQRKSSAGAAFACVVVVEPHVTMTNHTGETLSVRQAGDGDGAGGGAVSATTLTPDAASTPLFWASSAERERLQVRVERSAWSSPFALNLTTGQSTDIPVRATAGVGLYKLNPVVTHSLKAPGFIP
jgi:hypothetical protein